MEKDEENKMDKKINECIPKRIEEERSLINMLKKRKKLIVAHILKGEYEDSPSPEKLEAREGRGKLRIGMLSTNR